MGSWLQSSLDGLLSLTVLHLHQVAQNLELGSLNIRADPLIQD